MQDIEKGIKNFFTPETITHIGATNQEGKPGFIIYQKLLKSGKKIFPVNPKLSEINGKKVYQSVSDIKETPDLAVISIPAKPTVQVIKDCAEKGVKSAIIVAGGFKEAGEEGTKLEEEVIRISKEYGIRVLGPNTLGVFIPNDLYDTIFIQHGYNIISGGVTIITQSGSVGIEALGIASDTGFGLRAFVGLGNKCDVDELDSLHYFKYDKKTKAIGLYLESVSDGKKLLETLKDTAKTTPVVMLKAGKSSAGAGAVASHTGSLAGSDNVVDGALRANGIVRAMDDEELFDFSKVLAQNPPMKGNRVAIITPAGGYGVMLTDYLEFESRGEDLKLAEFSEETKQKLREVVFDFASVHNPIDLTASAGDEMYDNVLKVLCDSPDVDAVICVSFFAPPAISDDLIRIVAKNKRRSNKPIIAFTLYGEHTNEYLKIFDDHKVSAYSSTRRVVRALSVLKERHRYLEQFKKEDDVEQKDVISKENRHKIEAILLKADDNMLNEFMAKKVISLAGFNVPKGYYFNPGTTDLINDFKLEFPVVLKVCSTKIAHKTEVGGVKVGIKDLDELKSEIHKMAERLPNEHLLVEEMVKGDVEIIFGGLKDPDFGMSVMIGMGGIYTEVFRDVSFRPAPITYNEADRMMSELTCDKIFRGFRGKSYPREDVLNMIVKFSQLLDTFKEHVSQVDLNPIFVSEDRLTVLDAKIFLEK